MDCTYSTRVSLSGSWFCRPTREISYWCRFLYKLPISEEISIAISIWRLANNTTTWVHQNSRHLCTLTALFQSSSTHLQKNVSRILLRGTMIREYLLNWCNLPVESICDDLFNLLHSISVLSWESPFFWKIRTLLPHLSSFKKNSSDSENRETV